MIEIVLASASPRRTELLNTINLPFTHHPSDFKELDELDDAEALVSHNAFGKAQRVARHYREALIIGVDTVGSFQGQILNKPKDDEDAARILRLLSNTTHEVISAITIFNSKTKKNVTATETTKISFDRLSEADIAKYIASGEGRDKAAGYAIQGLGALHIKGIEGDYFNVVGMPLHLLKHLLKEFGVKI